jgi:beta-lactamase regulating signal transducer with metallopeptidase domain
MDLTTFQHSPFLSALGNAILNSLWQGFLFWIIYETIVISYKNTSAKGKHNLSALFIFSSFTWFIYTFISKLTVNAKSNFVLQGNNFSEQTGSISPFHEILAYSASILPYLSIAYILLLFFLMLKLFTAYKQVNFIAQKNLIHPEKSLQNFALKVASQLKISKKVKIWISKNIEVPATVGFIKPVILIPFASINNLSVDQLEAIILHEFSHIKRNDYLINLLVSVIETILFFNPFIAIFVKIIKRERENCCDDFVLQYRYDPHSYASALLKLEQGRNINLQLALGAVSGKKQLLSRIKRITGAGTVSQFNYGQKLLALLIMTGIFCSLAWISASNIKKEITPASAKNHLLKSDQPKTSSTETIIKEPEKKKIVLQKENSLELNKIEKEPQQEKLINGLNEKPALKKLSDKNPFGLFLKENNFKALPFKNIPKIQLEDFGFNVNTEINKGLKQAYIEISKIDWKKIQSDINKSMAEIKIEELPEKERAAIITAKKYLSIINLEKQQSNTSQIVKELQQQRMHEDSLEHTKSLLFQRARPAEQFRTERAQGLNEAPAYSFNFDNQGGNNRIRERKGQKPEENTRVIELRGKKININVRKNSLNVPHTPPSAQGIKSSRRIIVEI